MGLSAGLSTTVPDPEECDGTIEESVSQSTIQKFDNACNEANQYVTYMWTLCIFWPVLEVFGFYTINAVLSFVKFTIDLIKNIKVISIDAGLPNETELLQLDASILVDFIVVMFAYSIIKGGIAVMSSCEGWGLVDLSTIAAFAIGLGLVIVGTKLAIDYIDRRTDSGEMSHGLACLFYFALAMTMLSIIAFNALKGFLSFGLVMILCMLWEYPDPWKAAWSFLSELMKWTKIIVIFLFVFFLVLAGIEFYLWSGV